MSLVATQIKQAIFDRLVAALPAEKVFKSRQTPMGESTRRRLNVRIAGFSSETYTAGGSIDWRVTIEVSALSREGDDDAEDLLGLAHAALIQAPRELGVTGLYVDPAFSATTDVEDQIESLDGIAALYTCQVVTENSNA